MSRLTWLKKQKPVNILEEGRKSQTKQKSHPVHVRRKLGRRKHRSTRTRRLLSKPQLTVEGRIDSSGLTGNGTKKITGVSSQAAN